MANIQILDCTLRDGGYINDFDFGRRNIVKILSKLVSANIDIVECGFLEDGEYDENCSVFTRVEQITSLLPHERKNTMFVAMACYGEYDLSQLSSYDGSSIVGIRVTFHYNEVDDALEYCRKIKSLGYKIFVQPVGTTSYSDEQLLKLIAKVNKLEPYAFYLVDTLGLMVQADVARFFYLIDHNLDRKIHMGFHSHNNLQLSFSNCQFLASINSERVISLDASVYGMGRGAGNLNTELIANYLDCYCNSQYRIEPLLEIVDEIVSDIRAKYEWGYSVPYYLAAINGCHPNYASYLSGKKTLTVKEISSILRRIEVDKRSLFDKKLAESKYLEFQSKEYDDSASKGAMKNIVDGRMLLLIGPGPSAKQSASKIREYIDKNSPLVISVGFVPDFCKSDYVFISNIRRYQTTFSTHDKNVKILNTSNVPVSEENTLTFNYSSLLDSDPVIADNSLVMLLNLLTGLTKGKIVLAGFDGYRSDASNYYKSDLELPSEVYVNRQLNASMKNKISAFRMDEDIEFLTPSLYV